MLEDDKKMTSGDEKVIYRGDKEPTDDTRLPEAVDETMPVEDVPTEATDSEAMVEGEASTENSDEKTEE